MKTFNRLTLAIVLTLGMITFGCRPDAVKPSTNSDDVAAYLPSEHVDPSPICNTYATYELWGDVLGSSGQLGNFRLVNDKLNLYGIWSFGTGWVTTKTYIWVGQSVGVIPVGGSTSSLTGSTTTGLSSKGTIIDYDRFITDEVNPALFQFVKAMPLENLYETNMIMAAADVAFMDATGVPLFESFTVAMGGTEVEDGSYLTYTNALCEGEPATATPWRTGNPGDPNEPPVANCQFPSLQPGDDLSDYHCHTNGSKVGVCHLPPGNPDNILEICIRVDAISAHVVDFKPADNPCLGHHSGCHLGPCDPCGEGSTATTSRDAAKAFYDENGCTGSSF